MWTCIADSDLGVKRNHDSEDNSGLTGCIRSLYTSDADFFRGGGQ
jgi:hypothetical protein